MIKGLYTDEAWIAYTSSGMNNKPMDDKTARKDLAKTIMHWAYSRRLRDHIQDVPQLPLFPVIPSEQACSQTCPNWRWSWKI